LQLFINGRVTSQAVTGVQRYAEELLRALDGELGRPNAAWEAASFSLLVPPDARRLRTFKHISIRQVGRLRGHAWEQLELPWHARGGLLLSLANTGPLMKRHQVATVHDASVFAFPEAYSAAFRMWYQFLLPALGRRVRRVVTDSEFSKAELIRYSHIPADKLKVILLSGEHIRTAQAECGVLTSLGLRPRAYALAVGSQGPHKNFKVIMDSLQYLPARGFDVVVAGGQNRRIFSRAAEPLDPEIKQAGYVSDGELRALYENAGCFVYPSLYEGFGLPPVEAMACGCPVVVSREASLPEVCGNAALYCDARSPASVAEAMQRVMGDPDLQERLRGLGRSRASQLTWAAAARSLLGLIEEIASR
jgi:glycosyltransferase involved in cell wall biosynthesis